MCQIPGTQLDTMALDESLVSLFDQWKCYILDEVDEECYEDMDWVETFCTAMSNRLRSLKKEGVLDEAKL